MGFDNVNVNVSGGQNIINALQNYNTVILKPNIVDNRNVLTQEMMSERHTKYIIRWNYILEGATINVPEDCIIEFAGGTIDNGTIVGNNTMLMYSKPIDEVCLAERQGTFIYNTTVADEEDITSETGQLKFKDRPTTNGMGRKILRKNMVNGVNTLTQTMISQANTIYVIQYDFTLGEDVTVPANCVLEFDGGSVSGAYTFIGNNTCIQAGITQIFGTDIDFAGTWSTDVLNIKWFGAKGDNDTDDTVAFRNCIESKAVALGGYTILLSRGTYVISDTIVLPNRGVSIVSESREEVHYDEIYATCIRFLGENKELFRIKENTTNISFEKVSFRSYYQDGIDYKNNIAIKAMPISTNNPQPSKTIIMRDCNFLGFGYQFYVSGIPEKIDWQCDGQLIENCRFIYPAKAGIYINTRNGFDIGLIQNCQFSPKPLEDDVPSYGIDIDRCGYFKVLEIAAGSLLGSVSENSEAAIKTAFCNISDISAIGNIVFEQIQAESINRTININNISRGDKVITFNNCIFDSEIYIKNGPGKFIFNNCDWNLMGKILIDGNDIQLKGVPFTSIQLINGGINSYVINDGNNFYRAIKTLYIPDLLKISEARGITIDDVVNPCNKTFLINTNDTLMVLRCITVSNPFISSMAYKIKLFGAYNIGQDGHLQVKLRINSLDIKTLDTLSNSDLINGKFYKEYNICLELSDPNLLEHAVILDVTNVTGQIRGIVEQIF